MKKLLALAVASATTLFAASAFPCGAPFGAGMNVDPNQDIIVAHKGDRETYVFQPTFCGDAKDFGLILPVPSTLAGVPQLLPDANAFKYADKISQPTHVAQTKCRDFSDGVGGAADAGTKGGGTMVVASGTVGFLDWVQLKADSESAFTAWLDANGYPYDAKGKAAFDYYVAKGWYFLAFKVNQGGVSGKVECKSFGPIEIAFTSATPVIPSRMATAGATAGGYGFSWRVFGITDGTKQLDLSSAPSYTQKLGYSGALTAADAPNLAGLAAAGDRLTKLTFWFDGTAKDDVQLVTHAPADYRETVYDVTYVDCDAGAPIGDDAGPPIGDDAGSASSAAPASVGGGGCTTTGGASTAAASFALALAAVGLVARRRR